MGPVPTTSTPAPAVTRLIQLAKHVCRLTLPPHSYGPHLHSPFASTPNRLPRFRQHITPSHRSTTRFSSNHRAFFVEAPRRPVSSTLPRRRTEAPADGARPKACAGRRLLRRLRRQRRQSTTTVPTVDPVDTVAISRSAAAAAPHLAVATKAIRPAAAAFEADTPYAAAAAAQAPAQPWRCADSRLRRRVVGSGKHCSPRYPKHLNPRYVSYTASCDVASNISQTQPYPRPRPCSCQRERRMSNHCPS